VNILLRSLPAWENSLKNALVGLRIAAEERNRVWYGKKPKRDIFAGLVPVPRKPSAQPAPQEVQGQPRGRQGLVSRMRLKLIALHATRHSVPFGSPEA